jgi:hypothetical protein
MNMKINKVVVMYLETGEIVRPPASPDVSTVKVILSSYSFLFLVLQGLFHEQVNLLVQGIFTGERD